MTRPKTRAEYGTPYTVGEMEAFLEMRGSRLDPYVRDLMEWAANEIRRLQRVRSVRSD